MRKLVRIPNWYFAGALSSADGALRRNHRIALSVLEESGRVQNEEKKELGLNVHDREFRELDSSNGLVADITGPTTHGAEIDYAVRSGMPVLLTHHAKSRDSQYLNQWATANPPPPNLTYQTYSNRAELENIVRRFAKRTLRENPPLPGIYICVEGGEGGGKSTHSTLLTRHLRNEGLGVVVAREPGGTRLGENVRRILLDPVYRGLDVKTELLLHEAARAQLIARVVRPAMEEGKAVVTDRSFYSSLAYQGFGRQMGWQTIDLVNHFVTGGIKPDLAFIVDADPRVGMAKTTRTEFGKADSIERQKLDFHERVRQGYLAIARREPNVHLIHYVLDGADQMQAQIRRHADAFLGANYR